MAAIGPPPAPSDLPPVPFWRLERVEHHQVEEQPQRQAARPITAADLVPEAGRPPARQALAPWSRLWPFLYRALSHTRAGRKPDLGQVVRRLSRAERLERLPRRRHRAWSGHAVIVVDRSPRLTQLWFDQDWLCRRLRKLAGPAIQVVRLLDGPDGPTLGQGESSDTSWPWPEAAAPVLALSDLGLAGSEEDRDAWSRLGRRLQRAGHRLSALVPVPPSRWTSRMSRLWHPRFWDRGRAVADKLGDEQLQGRAKRLLRLLSMAVRIEPGLLRAVRLLLPQHEADAGTEIDAWAHPAVRDCSAVALTIDPEITQGWRRELLEEPEDLLGPLLALVKHWHRSLPREIQSEELLSASSLVPHMVDREELGQSSDLLVRAAATIADDHWTEEQRGSLHDWFRRIQQRLPADLWLDPELGEPLRRAWARVHRRETTTSPPPGFSIEDMVDNLGPAAAPSTWQVRQRGSTIRFEPARLGRVDGNAGSLLTTIVCGHRKLRVGADGVNLILDLDSRAEPNCHLPSGSELIIASDRQRHQLRLLSRLSWATAIGRDRWGLWIEIELAGIHLRMRWIGPGRFVMGSPETETGRSDDELQHKVTLTRGYWLAETPCTQALWQAVMGNNPSEFKTPDRPVERVSWNDVHAFLGRVNANGVDLRLPTEAEWEYACRTGITNGTTSAHEQEIEVGSTSLSGGTSLYDRKSGIDYAEARKDYPWLANQRHNGHPGSHPVAREGPNDWGMYDMLGNVWEWCEDWYGLYQPNPQTNPKGPAKGSGRVLRGGSWLSNSRYVRSSARNLYDPGFRPDYVGFRLARSG